MPNDLLETNRRPLLRSNLGCNSDASFTLRLAFPAAVAQRFVSSKMKRILNISFGLLIVTMPALGQITKGASPEELAAGHGTIVRVLDHRMTPAELRTFLRKRTSGQIVGPFHGYTSLLWALYNVGVWSEGAVADATPLENPYPENYSPTWKELMDVLARQVDCTWHYNHDTGYWVF